MVDVFLSLSVLVINFTTSLYICVIILGRSKLVEKENERL